MFIVDSKETMSNHEFVVNGYEFVFNELLLLSDFPNFLM